MSAPLLLNWDDISLLLGQVEVHDSMKQAFIEYSKGNAEIPPVGELLFEDPPGEVHIKYGYLKSGSHYVIKIASGFPNNEEEGIKPGQGMMLLFDINTGLPQAILVDEANLTDLRTGIAGAIASQTLANSDLEVATIIGSGVQARYQARCHVDLMSLNSLMIWARDHKKAEVLMDDLADLNITIKIRNDLEALVKESQLIITTT